MKTIKTLTISDLHGKDVWKEFADDSLHLNKESYDKYIFLGDYLDSFTHTDTELVKNFKDIIELKKKNPEKVILLIGNHELQYFFGIKGHLCSGYRNTIHVEIQDLYRKNKELFQTAYQIENYLWTHAGVHKGWYKNRFSKVFHDEDSTLADQLNEATKRNLDCIFDIGHRRGGYYDIGGPFWIDKIHMNKGLEGYHQITGHSKVKYIHTIKLGKDTSVTFTDCLDKQKEFYKKEIEIDK